MPTCPNGHDESALREATAFGDYPTRAYLCTVCGAMPRTSLRLVDTEAAEQWTSRPRGTLYRWASEGRITRYGKAGRYGARWDLAELPRYAHLCSLECAQAGACPPLPEPPRIRIPRQRKATS